MEVEITVGRDILNSPGERRQLGKERREGRGLEERKDGRKKSSFDEFFELISHVLRPPTPPLPLILRRKHSVSRFFAGLLCIVMSFFYNFDL